MADSSLIRTLVLDNGLTLNFYDQSNRYFGDFHRVLIRVEGVIRSMDDPADEVMPLPEELPDNVVYCRELERMGVTSDRLKEVVSELIESFLQSSKPYLDRPGIPEKLIRKKLAEKPKRRISPLKKYRSR